MSREIVSCLQTIIRRVETESLSRWWKPIKELQRRLNAAWMKRFSSSKYVMRIIERHESESDYLTVVLEHFDPFTGLRTEQTIARFESVNPNKVDFHQSNQIRIVEDRTFVEMGQITESDRKEALGTLVDLLAFADALDSETEAHESEHANNPKLFPNGALSNKNVEQLAIMCEQNEPLEYGDRIRLARKLTDGNTKAAKEIDSQMRAEQNRKKPTVRKFLGG